MLPAVPRALLCPRVLSRMVSKQWEVKSESDHTLTF
jgi:hypothetical protein